MLNLYARLRREVKLVQCANSVQSKPPLPCVWGACMSLFERLLVPGSTELPEYRCGKEMKVALTERVPDQTDADIRIYNCLACGHEMRLTVWADDLSA
jgi:hypothetical protein